MDWSSTLLSTPSWSRRQRRIRLDGQLRRGGARSRLVSTNSRANRPDALCQRIELCAASIHMLLRVCYQRSCSRVEAYFLNSNLFGSQQSDKRQLRLLDQTVGYGRVHEMVSLSFEHR